MPYPTRHRSWPLAVVVLLALALALGACSSADDPAPSAASTGRLNPLAGQSFFVNPDGPAARQARAFAASGRAGDAESMRWLARRPTATWIADARDPAHRVRALTVKAAARGEMPVLVAYHLPNRDCGLYSAGGAGSPAEYRRWIRSFARGLGDRRAIVIVEPDAIPDALERCSAPPERARRLSLLRHAVRTLGRQPRTVVYLDAGNPGWIRPSSRLLGPLRRAGIARADGFSLNVSNFHSTPAVVRYGRELSRRLGGAHFVVDTSRNGAGLGRSAPAGGPHWCNPPARALGRDPTARTGRPLVDAYLWIKVPGESDGACRPGAPPAGAWWPEYALELVRNRRSDEG